MLSPNNFAIIDVKDAANLVAAFDDLLTEEKTIDKYKRLIDLKCMDLYNDLKGSEQLSINLRKYR